MGDYAPTFGEFVRDNMPQFMTQKELAEECRISPQHIGDILHNRRTPTVAVTAKIADAINVSSDTLCIYAGKFPDDMHADLADVIGVWRAFQDGHLVEVA